MHLKQVLQTTFIHELTIDFKIDKIYSIFGQKSSNDYLIEQIFTLFITTTGITRFDHWNKVYLPNLDEKKRMLSMAKSTTNRKPIQMEIDFDSGSKNNFTNGEKIFCKEEDEK